MYERTGDRIMAEYPLATGNRIFIIARNLRRSPTGNHGRISISLDDSVLEFDVINLERREDRQKLGNAAWTKLGLLDKEALPKERLVAMVHVFCDGVWDAWMEASRASMLSGGSEIVPLQYWLPPFVMLGGSTIIFAPPGAGKTYIATIMARCIEDGISSVWPVRQGRTLFVQLERSAYSYGRRIQLTNRALGIDPAAPLLTLAARGRSLTDVIDLIRYHVENDGVEVVFIDSISRAGAGSLVEDRTANAIMDALNGTGVSWVALAHTSHDGKANGEKAHTFGSIMFEAAADIVVALTSQRQGNTLGVGLQITKANDGSDFGLHLLALEFDPAVGLSDIRAPREGEFAELGAGVRLSVTDRIVRYTLEQGRSTATATAEALKINRSHVASIYAGDTQFVAVEKVGREQFYGVRSVRA